MKLLFSIAFFSLFIISTANADANGASNSAGCSEENKKAFKNLYLDLKKITDKNNDNTENLLQNVLYHQYQNALKKVALTLSDDDGKIDTRSLNTKFSGVIDFFKKMDPVELKNINIDNLILSIQETNEKNSRKVKIKIKIKF